MKRTIVRSLMLIVGIVTLFGMTPTAQAIMLGDTIHGAVYADGIPGVNFFDPINGLVPAGSSGIQPTAVVTDPDIGFVEFIVGEPGSGALTVDVDAGSITIELSSSLSGLSIPGLDIVLSDLDETSMIVVGLDEFPGGITVGSTSHSIHIRTEAFTLSAGTVKAELDVLPNPEPGTVMLLGTGLIGLLGYGWRRKHHIG